MAKTPQQPFKFSPEGRRNHERAVKILQSEQQAAAARRRHLAKLAEDVVVPPRSVAEPDDERG